jgi:hypothetical protein
MEPERKILRNQFYCRSGNIGYQWMRLYMRGYDELPKTIRERLQQSPFNICTECLGDTRDCDFTCIEVREYQIRSGQR